MEVLRSNFESKLPDIEKAMLEADFIAVDAEFTGLTTPDIQFQQTDDLSVRYSKMKSCVQEFTIIQYGVCAFKKDKHTGAYEAKPFNFYIFGADTNEVQSRRIFSATPSSLTFLRSNKFDFNRLIEEGIPFYNFNEESSMFQSAQGTNVVNRRTMIKESALNKSGRSFLEYNRESIKRWLQGNTEKPLLIQVNSGFYRKLIYQEIQDSKYSGFLQASQRDSRHLEITRVKEEERRKRSSNSPKLNFRTIIDIIRRAKCPVVAHNAAFDIFHTVDQFWQYLPENIEDFKTICNSMWPTIVDTKYLAEYHPILKTCFDTTVLGSLFNSIEAELKEAGQEIVMAEGFDRYKESDNAHEAGYDAYMTGTIYLAFIKYIHEKQEEQKQKEMRKAPKRKRSQSESDSDSRLLSTASSQRNQKKIFKDDEEDTDSNENEKDKEDTQTLLEEGEVDESKEEQEEGEAEESTNEHTPNSDSNSDSDSGSGSDSDSDSDSDSVSASDSDESQEEVVKKKKNSIFMQKSIMPYYGRIFLMRSDTPYINLKGQETVEIVTYPNKFYLHNIPPGMTNTAIEKLYEIIQPFAVSWINDSSAWIILKDETKIPFVKTGVLGLSLVHSFLPGCSRQIEGEAYGITKEAGKMELLSHEQWQEIYGPKRTVNYNNTASIMRANNFGQSTALKELIANAPAAPEASPVTESIQQASTMESVPTGGAAYDELDIPIPPSFAVSLKRKRENDDIVVENSITNKHSKTSA